MRCAFSLGVSRAFHTVLHAVEGAVVAPCEFRAVYSTLQIPLCIPGGVLG